MMKKLSEKWRNAAWRRNAAKTVGKWIVMGVAKEILRYAWVLWMQG
ncbi:hypothetical protein ACGF8B_41105 [Streptomyces sp. NPDC047917]